VTFVGYDRRAVETSIIGIRTLADGRVAMMLRESPFYAESGGQISDVGEVIGEGWRLEVDDVRKIDGKPVVIGKAIGTIQSGPVTARVPSDRRLDIERNHTATHLLHAALRQLLGDHVHQAGSLVAPDRLRFDFTHHGPLTADQVRDVEDLVNRGVLSATPVVTRQTAYQNAIASGAMALFGEKYGDVVRVVEISEISAELCGGTHVRNTAEIGLFKVVSESGIAAGVRRLEAITGSKAYEFVREQEQTLRQIAELVKATPATAVKRVQTLADERRALEKRVTELMRGSNGSGPVQALLQQASEVKGLRVVAQRSDAHDVKALQELAELVREQAADAVVVLAASFDEGKNTVVVAVGDAARERGVQANAIIKVLAERVGGRGGGKAQLAQAGIPDAAAISPMLAQVVDVVAAQVS
jgi:alanyl-tRNA synthetase